MIFSSEKYVADAQTLHEHVLRLNHHDEVNGTSINCMKISFDHEYPWNYTVPSHAMIYASLGGRQFEIHIRRNVLY